MRKLASPVISLACPPALGAHSLLVIVAGLKECPACTIFCAVLLCIVFPCFLSLVDYLSGDYLSVWENKSTADNVLCAVVEHYRYVLFQGMYFCNAGA